MPDGNDMASTVGMMGALRTGNPIIDMLIAMVIPVIFQRIMSQASHVSWLESVNAVIFFWSRYYTRDIEHKMVTTSWGGTFAQDRNLRNNVLIKAIQLYLEHAQVEYRNANVQLVSTKNESDRFWEDDSDGENTAAGKLKRFKVARKPPTARWTTVTSKEDVDRVELMVVEHEQDKGEKAEKTQVVNVYKFRSTKKGAIDSFVDSCYAWYIEELKKQEDNSRYLYEMQIKPTSFKSSGDDDSSERLFKRYKLSDEKQFGSLFFDEKEKLLGMLNHFLHKTGKYAVQGYPHKLGLLLHGPPRTGKTSLIKALAQYTGRSIINVPLARITTNAELMDIMFDQSFPVAGDDVPIKLGFKDVIFVMEDVDAASKVVQRRDGKTGKALRFEGARGASIELEAATPEVTSPWHLLLGSADAGVKELVEELMEKSARLRAAAIAPESVRAMAARLRVPKPPGPTSDKERAEYEKKSPAERSAAHQQKAQEALNASCERLERTETFVRAHAATLRRLLQAGGAVDAALEDELLGLAPLSDLAKPRDGSKQRKAELGYSGGVAEDNEEEEEEEEEGVDMQMMQAMMMSMMTSGGGGSAADGMGGASSGGGGYSSGPPYSCYGSSSALKKDKLNLSGLLNVLDGVVDTPERIVVMTTNHPEILDPALIRPGRIDQKLLLSHMKAHNVTAMIEHYFQLGVEGLSASCAQRVHRAVNGDAAKGIPPLELTPAQVEQLSAEHDDVEGMVAAIEAKVVGAGAAWSDLDEAKAMMPLAPRRKASSPSKTRVAG